MARIRHIGIKTVNPERLAKFYEDVFDMKVQLRRETGAIYMTDGYMNVAILPNRADGPNGLNHFGFLVDDMDEVAEKLRQAGADAPRVRPNNPPYAEQRAMDPDGNNFDLSVHGYDRSEFQEERAEAQDEKTREPADA